MHVFPSTFKFASSLGGAFLAIASAALGMEPRFVALGDLNQNSVPFNVSGQGAYDSTTPIRFYFPATSNSVAQVWMMGADLRARPLTTAPNGTAPTGLSQFYQGSNCVVFVGDAGQGPELWRADPTGISPLAQIQQGNSHPAPTILGAGEGRVYLTTPHPNLSGMVNLWHTSGNNISPVGVFGDISDVTLVDNILFFTAKQTASSTQRFLFSASTSTVRMITQTAGAEIPVTPSGPLYAITADNQVYYRNKSAASSDFEIYRVGVYGGTPELVKDIVVGAGGSNPAGFTAAGNTVYFSATTAAQGRELWKSAGAAATTVLVADILAGPPSSNPQELRGTRSGVFFLADDADGYRDLWSAGASFSGAFQCANLNFGSSGVANWVQPTIRDEFRLWYWRPVGAVFDLYEAKLNGVSLPLSGDSFVTVDKMWTYNPTSGSPQTYVVGNTHHAPGQLFFLSPSGDEEAVGTLTNARWPARGFFPPAQLMTADQNGVASLFSVGPGIGFSQATSSSLVTEGSFPREFTEFGGKLFFTGMDGSSGQRQFYMSSGAETSVLAASSFDPLDLTVFSDRIYNRSLRGAVNSQHRRLGWVEFADDAWSIKIDENEDPTELVGIATLGDWLYTVEETSGGLEQYLHIYDGAHELTENVQFAKGLNQKGVDQFMPGATWLFMVTPFGQGREVYAIKDGNWTNHKTTDWINGSVTSDPKLVGVLGDTVLFRASDGTAEFLWSWHPGDVAPVKVGSTLPKLRTDGKLRQPAGVAFDGAFYFVEDSPNPGLWRTDGTAAGTERIDNAGTMTPEGMAVFQGSLYYFKQGSLISIASTGATPQVKYIILDTLGATLVSLNGRLWMSVYLPDQPPSLGGTTLYVCDGTGPLLVMDSVHRNLSGQTFAQGYRPEFGTYRNHVVVNREPPAPVAGSSTGNEPWIINRLAEAGPSHTFPGLRNQPVTLTYEQFAANNPVMDEDGDPLRLMLDSLSEGTLTINGQPFDNHARVLLPGDTFVWTPEPGTHGVRPIFEASLRDFLNEARPIIQINANLRRPVDLWSETRFTAEELELPEFALPESDPEHDGVSNGLEYVMGLDPKVNDGSPVTTLSVKDTPEGPRLVFRFIHIPALGDDCRLNIELATTPAPEPGIPATLIAMKPGNGTWTMPAQFHPLSGTPLITGSVLETILPDGRIQVDLTCPGLVSDWGDSAFLWLRPEL